MPWTYNEFLQNTDNKGFTEKDIEIIYRFIQFSINAKIHSQMDY